MENNNLIEDILDHELMLEAINFQYNFLNEEGKRMDYVKSANNYFKETFENIESYFNEIVKKLVDKIDEVSNHFNKVRGKLKKSVKVDNGLKLSVNVKNEVGNVLSLIQNTEEKVEYDFDKIDSLSSKVLSTKDGKESINGSDIEKYVKMLSSYKAIFSAAKVSNDKNSNSWSSLVKDAKYSGSQKKINIVKNNVEIFNKVMVYVNKIVNKLILSCISMMKEAQ